MLRLKVLTSGAALLTIPRGKHLLRIRECKLLPNSVTFYSSTPFVLQVGRWIAECLVTGGFASMHGMLAWLCRDVAVPLQWVGSVAVHRVSPLKA